MAGFVKRRVVCTEECQCDSGERSLRARFRDLSVEGAFLRTSNPFPVGERIHVSFQLEEKKIDATAEVRHSSLGYGMGVEFLSMRETHRQALRDYVSSQIQRLRVAAYSRVRRAPRTTLRTHVRIVGRATNGELFTEDTDTFDVSDIGARVLLKTKIEQGELVAVRNLRNGGSWAQFRTVWQGTPGTEMEGHAGLELNYVDLWGLHELGRP